MKPSVHRTSLYDFRQLTAMEEEMDFISFICSLNRSNPEDGFDTFEVGSVKVDPIIWPKVPRKPKSSSSSDIVEYILNRPRIDTDTWMTKKNKKNDDDQLVTAKKGIAAICNPPTKKKMMMAGEVTVSTRVKPPPKPRRRGIRDIVRQKVENPCGDPDHLKMKKDGNYRKNTYRRDPDRSNNTKKKAAAVPKKKTGESIKNTNPLSTSLKRPNPSPDHITIRQVKNTNPFSTSVKRPNLSPGVTIGRVKKSNPFSTSVKDPNPSHDITICHVKTTNPSSTSVKRPNQSSDMKNTNLFSTSVKRPRPSPDTVRKSIENPYSDVDMKKKKPYSDVDMKKKKGGEGVITTKNIEKQVSDEEMRNTSLTPIKLVTNPSYPLKIKIIFGKSKKEVAAGDNIVKSTISTPSPVIKGGSGLSNRVDLPSKAFSLQSYKLEGSKRKLREQYNQIDNEKKKRRIQVIEFQKPSQPLQAHGNKTLMRKQLMQLLMPSAKLPHRH